MGQSLLGCTVLKGKDGSGSGGILHWRACLGVICLHEESVDLDLVDNSAQFRYGGRFISVFFFCVSSKRVRTSGPAFTTH